MAHSYALPARQADTTSDFFITPNGTPQHSRASSLHLSPNRAAANGGGGAGAGAAGGGGKALFMNGNGNGTGTGSFVRHKVSNGSAGSASLLYTHAERSNEASPQPSPVEEPFFTQNNIPNPAAPQQNGRHSHSHSHAHDNHFHAHDHNHSHRHSFSSPMKRPTRPRGESDLGRPAGSFHPQLQKASTAWFSLPEALTSLLIPLPYMLASAAYHPGGFVEDGLPPLSAYERLQKSVLEDSPAGGQNLLVRRGCGFVEACTLTSGTLLLVGFVAKLRAAERMLDRRKDKVETSSISGLIKPASIQQMLSRALGIGLPFYASTQIGGMRTGIVLLVASTSGLSLPRPSWRDWQHMLKSRMASLAVLSLAALLDFSGITFKAAPPDMLIGYLALACSIFFIPPPLPSLGASSASPSCSSGAPTPTTPLTGRSPWSQVATSSLVSSVNDVNLTLVSGVVMSIWTVLISGILATSPPITPLAIAFTTLSLAASVTAIFFAQPSALRNSSYKTGLGVSCFTFAVFAFLFSPSLWPGTIFNGGLSALSYFGVLYDTSLASTHQHHDSHAHAHEHAHVHNALTPSHNDGVSSVITRYLLENCDSGSLMHGILSEKDSRRIAYFTCLNFGFMIVQGIYGYLSGSLGLLSDTVHMFFDCLGLVVGLGAAVASKWPTSPDRPYGWGKLNTLAGFGNGIFLMLVSVEFIWEAMEGIAEQKELRHVAELLVVSTLGFLVNMVGLFAFGHAHHGHDHGGHSHGHTQDHSHSHTPDHGHLHDHSHSHSHAHGHGNHNSVHSHKANDSTGTNGDISGYCNHKHEVKEAAHSHEHHDHNDNMHGIFLHVAADAGGSAAVILSTAMTLWKPWYLWDPLATIIIAILIFAAAVPLVISSGQKLLLVIPDTLEYEIKGTLQELGELRGVVGYAAPRFWIDDREDAADSHGHHHSHDHGSGGSGKKKVQGVIHIIANPAADLDDVRHRVDEFMRDRRMDVVIHVEREAEGTCWCGGGHTGSVSGF